jgi:predicted metal-dependent hydrolase
VVVQDGPARVAIRNKRTLNLFVREGSDTAQRERVLHAWYRQQLKALIPSLIELWEAAMGVKVAEWGVKQMKTKWGACNIKARRIWLNLELAKKPVRCLAYIIIHEMAHLSERHHNDRFTKLMDSFMPQWRLQRAELNRAPLGHATWKY